MRNGYDYPAGNGPDLPGQRDEGLRRLRTLTWRVTQLGALATVGIATVFARTAPMQADSQTVPVATPAAPAPSQAPTLAVGPAKSHKAAARKTRAAGAAGVPSAQAGTGTVAATSAPTKPAPTSTAPTKAAPATSAPATLTPPATTPAPAPTTADPGADRHEHLARGKLMPASPAGQHTFNALGTFATLLVSDPEALPDATEILIAELAAIDLACSRFRQDSELWRACSASGRPVQVSPLFAAALDVALSAARLTDGDVDPTCGRSLTALGYDRDFVLVRQDTGPASLPPVAGGGWRAIRLDTAGGTVTVPDGVLLDLGATAKAFAADRAAAAIAAATDAGVLVNLGGDISVAGPAPEGGWLVGVADDARFDTTTDSVRIRQTVLISDGGLATSSVLGRSWRRGGTTVHHIIAPSTGLPASSCWRTVTVAAATCVAANIAATAAIVRGEPAADWLRATVACPPAWSGRTVP